MKTSTSTTKRADYILTEFEDGTVAIISSPHDGSEGDRSTFRNIGNARHWLKMQQEHDTGRPHATQGLLK